MARRNASDLETFQRRAVCSSERTVSTSSAKVDLIVILAISLQRYGHIGLEVQSPHGCCPHGCWARRNECCRPAGISHPYTRWCAVILHVKTTSLCLGSMAGWSILPREASFSSGCAASERARGHVPAFRKPSGSTSSKEPSVDLRP